MSNPIKEAILTELKNNIQEYSMYDLDYLNRVIFKNKSTFRLTYEGCMAMKSQFNSYAYQYGVEELKGKHKIVLTRYFKFPYYLAKNELIVFTEDDAILLALHGDVAHFLEHVVY